MLSRFWLCFQSLNLFAYIYLRSSPSLSGKEGSENLYTPGVHFSCISEDCVISFSNTDQYKIIRGRYTQDVFCLCQTTVTCEWHRGINEQTNKRATYFLQLAGETMLHYKLQAVLRSFELFCKFLRTTCCCKLTKVYVYERMVLKNCTSNTAFCFETSFKENLTCLAWHWDKCFFSQANKWCKHVSFKKFKKVEEKIPDKSLTSWILRRHHKGDKHF